MRQLLPILLLSLMACDPASVGDGDVTSIVGDLPSDRLAPPMNLAVTDVIAGGLTTWTATGANPGDMVWFLRGPLGASCPPLLNGECLGIHQVSALGNAVADPSGTATLSLTVPFTVPHGLSVNFQAAVQPPPTAYTSPVVTVVVGEVTTQPSTIELLVTDGTSTIQHLDADGVQIGTIPSSVGAVTGVAWDHINDDGLWVIPTAAPTTVQKIDMTGALITTLTLGTTIVGSLSGLDVFDYPGSGPSIITSGINRNNIPVIWSFQIATGDRWSEAGFFTAAGSTDWWGNAAVGTTVSGLIAWQTFDNGMLAEVQVGGNLQEIAVAGAGLRGVDTAENGDIYVADSSAGTVLHLAPDGSVLATFTVPGATGVSVIE